MSRSAAAWLMVVAGCNGAAFVDECPSGVICNAPPAALSFAAEVAPPTGSGLVRQEVAHLAFDEHGAATVQLRPRAQLQGYVLGANDAPVPAQVIVTGPSLIPGRGAVVLQTTTDSKGQFEIDLPRASDASWVVRVVPQPPADTLYAPATWPLSAGGDRLLPSDGHGAGNPLLLCLASGSRLCPAQSAQLAPITGRLLDASGAPLPSARVAAVDSSTGAARSSYALTDGKGRFQVVLSPELQAGDPVQLVAAPPTERALPTLTRSVSAGDTTEQELMMPQLPPAQRFLLPVGGRTTAGVDKPQPGARVEVQIDFSPQLQQAQTSATFRATVLSDEQGLAAIDLVPGTAQAPRVYQVAVTPPADSPFARTRFELPVGAYGDGALKALGLAQRWQIVGHLVNADGQPVKGATASAQGAAASVDGPIKTANDLSSPTAVTSGDGSFDLRVDPGPYDVELVPPAGASLPRWSLDNRDVSAGDLDLRVVRLPRAALTHVTVLDPSGQPVTGVAVRVFAVAMQTNCPQDQPSGCALAPRLRGEGVTAQGGAAPLLLPAP